MKPTVDYLMFESSKLSEDDELRFIERLLQRKFSVKGVGKAEVSIIDNDIIIKFKTNV